MKKKDYYGKYIIGGEELKPIEITKELCQKHRFLKETLDKLYNEGLMFDSKEEAELALTTLAIVGREIRDRKISIEEEVSCCKPPRIYISGPISGHDIEERRKAFQEIEWMLEAQGYDVFNPTKNGLPPDATTHEHMKRDIEQLMTCDYIYMMRRWTHSKGSKVEFDVATSIGLPVFFEESGEITKFE